MEGPAPKKSRVATSDDEADREEEQKAEEKERGEKEVGGMTDEVKDAEVDQETEKKE